jgi:O-antigen/teichoic acid export membrane protein
LYAESSDAKRGGERGAVRTVVLKVLTGLVPIALLASLILLFFSEELIGVIFGENWRPAGEYARALTVLAIVRMFVTPMAALFNVFEKQKLQLLLNIARLILIGIVFIFISFQSLAGPDAVVLYACILSFYNIAIAALAWFLVNDSFEK